MNSKNGFLTTLLLMAALVCFIAGPAMAGKPWIENPPGQGAGGPGVGSEIGNSAHAVFDEGPWHDVPPGAGGGGPGWDSQPGNSGCAVFDDNPWNDNPPGQGTGGPGVGAVPGEGIGLRTWLLWLLGY